MPKKAPVVDPPALEVDEPTAEAIVGWMKPEVDKDGKPTGKDVYAQELIRDVTYCDEDNGHLTVDFGEGDFIKFAPGIWYFARFFSNGVPPQED